jgi:hypothetical protein
MMSNLSTTRAEPLLKPILRPVLRMNCKMLFSKHQRDCGAVKVLLNISICFLHGTSLWIQTPFRSMVI